MYCPSCGAEQALDLNYCNRCGANMTSLIVSQPIEAISITKPVMIIGILTTILTIGGFGVLAIGAYNLAQVFKEADPIMAMMMLGISTIMVSDIILLRLMSRIIRSSLEPKAHVQTLKTKASETPRQFVANDTSRQLGPKLEPVGSVTDHTTRTFPPAYREAADRGTK